MIGRPVVGNAEIVALGVEGSSHVAYCPMSVGLQFGAEHVESAKAGMTVRGEYHDAVRQHIWKFFVARCIDVVSEVLERPGAFFQIDSPDVLAPISRHVAGKVQKFTRRTHCRMSETGDRIAGYVKFHRGTPLCV